jgi:signal transduction histidine kinase
MIQQEKLASIGLLAAGVAHEINTPLTGIKSYAQMLMQEELEDEQRELVDNVLQQSNRAGRIVRDLLDFTRKDTSVDEIINLNHVIEQTFTLLAHTLKKNQISYSFIPEKSIILIKGNANQLQQVFINLVVNAIDAMQAEGVLSVTIDEKKDGIHALVQDNGSGIDSRTINRMFDPFFTTKEAGKGTGLGLSVVYNILHEHRAEISVNSKKGEGTTMHILFPSPGSIDHD